MNNRHDNYSNLKNHLNAKFNLINESDINNELINEGLMDAISKVFGKKPADDKANQATGLFGWISLAANQIKGIFGSGSSETKTDRISAKYNDLAKREMEDEERRLKDEIKAEEDLEIEKLESEYKVNRQRLDAKSKARVEAYQAKKQQVKNIGDRIAKSKLLYSEEDTQMLLNTIKKAGKDLEVDGDSPIAEMRDLTLQILIKPDGTTRTLDEIKKEVDSNPDSDLAKLVKRQSDMATKYKQQSLTALDSDAFKHMVKKHCGDISELDNAKIAVNTAKDDQKTHKNKTAAYTALTKMKDAHESAAKEVGEATDALAKLIGGDKADGKPISNNDRDPFCMSYDKDSKKVGALGTKDYKEALKTAINQVKQQGDISDEEKNQAIKDKLKELGIDDENLVSNLFADGGDMDAKIDGLSDDEINKMAKKTAEKMTSKVAEAQAKVTNAKTKLSENPNPATEEGRNAIKETGTDDQKALLETYNAAGNPELSAESEFYEGSSANTAKVEEIQSKITKNQKIVDDATVQTKANITQLQNAQAADESRKTKQVPDELKEDIEKAASGIQAGEVVCGEGEHKGKIGFYKSDPENPDKKIFVPKPKHGSTEKDEKDYIAARNLAIMQTQPKDIGDGVWDDIGKIKANDDGTYTIYDKKGNVYDDKASREDAINIRAAQVSKERSRAQAIQLKQNIAEKLKGINKNGELDHKALKALEPEEQAVIRDMIKSGKDFSEFFKGIDLNDSDLTADDIGKAFPKDLQKEFMHEIDADDDKGEGDDWEDDEEDNDGDEDLKTSETEEDENDVEDDNDNAKNDAGEELVKGDDGKWYKKKEDGSADTDAGEQTNVAKKKGTLKNPAKEWRRRKNKVTGKKTKNYFNVHDKTQSISRKEFLKRMENYKKAIAKRKAKEQNNETFNYINLGNHLFESIDTNNNKYSNLRNYILSNVNN